MFEVPQKVVAPHDAQTGSQFVLRILGHAVQRLHAGDGLLVFLVVILDLGEEHQRILTVRTSDLRSDDGELLLRIFLVTRLVVAVAEVEPCLVGEDAFRELLQEVGEALRSACIFLLLVEVLRGEVGEGVLFGALELDESA